MAVRLDKLTLQAQEAVQEAQNVASRHSHQELVPLYGQLGHLLGDFNDGPEGFLLGGLVVGGAPSFQVELNGFTEIGTGRFHIFSLRSNRELGTPGHVPVVFFSDKGRESTSHARMLDQLLQNSKLGGWPQKGNSITIGVLKSYRRVRR